jgi:2-phosphosulfolactate phosphatase
VTDPHSQSSYQVRFDWGIEGARTVAADADVIVIVDVLSFCTTVDVAVAGGGSVELAAADGLGADGESGKAGQPGADGSRIAAALAGHSGTVIAGSLRNATAVAQWILAHQDETGNRLAIAIIAAGDRRGGAARVTVEDLLGAGAIIDALAAIGLDACSPEAAAAAASFAGLKRATRHLITASASGRELADLGFADDVRLAVQTDVSSTIPVLREFAFRA